ncbi:tyrosine-type recombinase/integrase [Streptomyces sulphureus]|uniref:tyrosine-type recombinase/integrase n=1 Tax=Streptomyces sulphureus TaxID=47758 RepID=UPI00037A2B78|nr:site-specific integrase [Streptomyces sulphureus]
MASIVERPRKGGESTFQVKWRQDGSGWQSEKFGDRTSAESFKKLVDAHEQRWPHGWVRGQGFVEEVQQPGDMPLVEWAHRYVSRLTGVDERTQDDYRRDVDLHLSVLRHTQPSGRVIEATIGNLTADDVQDWVRAQKRGEPDPERPGEWLRRKAGPKSIANRHGLLWCVVQAGVEAQPPMRTANCCAKTKLPRIDDGITEEMVFLEREEYARIARELTDPRARELADWLVGTGMRWGEATALQVRDLRLRGSERTVTVQRSWRKRPKAEAGPAYLLGAPKTKRSRRVVALTGSQAEVAARLASGRQPESFLFQTARGRPWSHSNFYNNRWRPAVSEAVARGLPRRPRIHDLRHTHVSWLIAARIPLPAIQARLGHESITTTVDRYGHLVRELDAEIVAAVDAAMAEPGGRDGRLSVVV